MSDQKTKKAALTLDPNLDLRELFGAGDCHLKRIADNYEVRITATGNTVTIQAAEYSPCQNAKKVLEELASIVKTGRKITEDLVENKIASANLRSPNGALVKEFNSACLKLKSKEVLPRNESQASYLTGILKNEISFGVGDAGTGKTWLAVAAAISAYERGEVKKIILCRPAVEAGERLGFLPGDQKEKVDPYFMPIYDALKELLPGYDNLIKNGTIEIAPLAFMRGRTLKDAFIILDEAQNTTKMQMKMFLTRLGDGSKMVITGDHTQIDLPGGAQESGLVQAVKAMEGVEGIFIHKFSPKDVVRHRMVGRMLTAYEKLEASERAAKPATLEPNGP